MKMKLKIVTMIRIEVKKKPLFSYMVNNYKTDLVNNMIVNFKIIKFKPA